MIDLSVIVVSYNTRELTLDCLASIYEQTTQLNFEVIVLDNCSVDGSAEAISTSFPQVKLIAQKSNSGFAEGNNIAIKEARGTTILLLNPDTLVLDGAIEKLYSFAKENPNAQIWGGRTLFGDGSLNPSSCWRETFLWEIFCRSFLLSTIFPRNAVFNTGSYGGWDRSTVKQVDIVSGCFFMLPHSLWLKLDGFSSEFFMYGEEADLCLRARKFGARPMVTPEATIIHYGGASESIRADKMVKLLKAKRLLMKFHWPAWKYKLGMLIFPLYPLNRAIVAKILGFVKPRFKEEEAVWQEIWQRRQEWLA